MEIFTDYLFTQGILGVVVLGLLYDRFRLTAKLDEKDQKIEALHRERHQGTVEMLKEVNEVVRGNSQNMALLSEKIEVAKRGRGNGNI